MQKQEIRHNFQTLISLVSATNWQMGGRAIEIRCQAWWPECLKSAFDIQEYLLNQFDMHTVCLMTCMGKEEIWLSCAQVLNLQCELADDCLQLCAAFFGQTADEIQIGVENISIECASWIKSKRATYSSWLLPNHYRRWQSEISLATLATLISSVIMCVFNVLMGWELLVFSVISW